MTVDGVAFAVYHYFGASDSADETEWNALYFFGGPDDMETRKVIEGTATFESIVSGNITPLVRGDEECDALERLASWGRNNGVVFNRYRREPNGESTFPDVLVEVNEQPVYLEITRIMVGMGRKQTYRPGDDEFPKASGSLREIITHRISRKAARLDRRVSRGAPHYLALIDVCGVLEPGFDIWKQTRLREFERSFLVSPLRDQVFELSPPSAMT